MTRTLTLAFASFLLVTGCATASEKVLPRTAIDKTQFETTKAHLIAELDDEHYQEITPEAKKAVIAALDRISVRVAKPDPMSDKDVVDTFNDEQLINTITSHAAIESRLYCERDMPLGSHRIRVTCMTIAKWMERDEAGRTAMYQQVENTNRSSDPNMF